MPQVKFVRPAVAVALMALVAGCGQGGAGPSTGTMTLGITDAPVDDAEAVMIKIDGLELKPETGERLIFRFNSPTPVNVLELQNGARKLLLDGITVPAGRYSYVRLMISADSGQNDSYIQFKDGSVHPLYIPSGEQSGLKLNRGFTVPVNGEADFTIDMDLRRSIHSPSSGSDYMLRPTLRIVQTNVTGSIAGTVNPSVASAPDCQPAVYVYEGAGVTPDDVGSGSGPVSSAQVRLDSATGEYKYRVAYLLEGAYTAAFTCQAGADDPAVDDNIAFLGATEVTVAAGQTSDVNF